MTAWRRWVLAAVLLAGSVIRGPAALAGQDDGTSAAPPQRGPHQGAEPRRGQQEDGTRLMRGETVTYEQTIENEERRYVGGVTYTIVGASLPRLARVLEDVSVYVRILPATKSARLIAKKGPDTWVELTQGNAVIETSYTLHMRADADGATVRFWLDKTRPHGLEDAWGFFRATPLEDIGTGPRALVTYGALLDLGPGVVRTLFEERLRSLMLSVPSLLRDYVAKTRETARPPPPADALNQEPGAPSTPALPPAAGAATR